MKIQFLLVPAHCHGTSTDTSPALIEDTRVQLARKHSFAILDAVEDEGRLYLNLVQMYAPRLERNYYLARFEDAGKPLRPFEIGPAKKKARAPDTDQNVSYQ